MILRYAKAFQQWHSKPVNQDNWQQVWAMACLVGAVLVTLLCLFCGLVMADSIFNWWR